MAMTAKEIKEWLATIDDEKMVAIGEDLMSLVVKGEKSYCEIGGIPVAKKGIAEDFEELEPGWEDHR